MHADFKIDLKIGEENEKIEVIRWQFPLLHGMLRTAYSAQGLTLDGGVLVDLRRAGGLEDDDWWLAIYVMLTRARKLENLILLGMTAQVEDLLRRGPPAYLREFTDKLEAKGLWSACRTGLCMTQCKLPDIILCIWVQPLVGGAICWNKRWLNALEVYWHVWCLLFILLICWQVVAWHDLACLVQRMLLVTHCNAFVIWACAVAATIAFDFASGGMLPCLMPVSLFIFDRWYPDMIWHVCCGMFWHVCFCQVVYWHVLANGCDLFTWTLLTGAILSSRQDTTRSCKNPEKKDAGLAGFEMHLLRSVWSLPANLLYFVRRLSASGPWNKTRWQP